MATWQHLRSSTANKRPTTSLADGRIAINTNTASPGLFFKDSAGTGIVKVGPVHVGTTAPNSVPAAGGSSGNYTGEQWLDTSVSPAQMKVWNGSTWVGIVADELPVSKLQDGAARQLIQTDAAGTGVEWTSDVDVPGTLDVTSTATFDSIAQHPLGTAGAPTITFTGDNNTGIYSPGADQLAISTGGSGRLFVDASGNVGVGLTSPASRFHIYDSVAVLTVEGASTSSASLQFKTNSNNRFKISTPDSSADLAFYSSGSTERLRITSAGLVGVGTSSPAGLLHANTTNGNVSYFGGPIGITSGNYTGIQIGYTELNGTYAKSMIVQEQTGDGNARGKIHILNNNTGSDASATLADARLTITSAGNVGVGTTSPASLLTSYAGNVSTLGAKASTGLLIENNGSVGNISQIGLGYTFSSTNHPTAIAAVTTSGAGSTRADLVFATRDLTTDVAPTERLRIDSSGRVGIGTSSPGAKLDIASLGNASSVPAAIFRGDAGTGNSGGLALYNSSVDVNERNWYIVSNSTVYGDFVIKQGTSQGSDPTSGTNRFYINPSGNVGIGTTSPATLLHVNTGSNATAITVAASTATSGQLLIGTGAKVSGQQSIVSSGNGLDIATLFGVPITFYTSDTERARIDASGRLLVGTSSSTNVNIATFQGNSSVSTGTGIVNIALGNTSPGTTDQLGRLQFTDSGHNSAAEIIGQRDGGTWNTSTSRPTRLVFSTTADGASSPTERVRLTNAGNLNVFSSDVIYARSSAAAGFGNYLYSGWHSATGTTNGTLSFAVYTNGNVQNTNNAYGSLSDIKLKENIVDANSQWSDLKALQVRNYNFKEGETHTQIGLVAQEVELVSPGLVTESPDRDAEGNDLGTTTKSVNYSVLYMKAVKALQEAMERIETLETKVAALESA